MPWWKPHVASQVIGQMIRQRSPVTPGCNICDQDTDDAPCAVPGDQIVNKIVEPQGLGMKVRVHHGLDTSNEAGPLGLDCG